MNHHSAQYFKADAGAFSEKNAQVSLPRINVVVTCFNYGRFVGEALDSVAAQSYQNFDCVIVDDASTDNSFETVKRWISNKQDDRFKLMRNEPQAGSKDRSSVCTCSSSPRIRWPDTRSHRSAAIAPSLWCRPVFISSGWFTGSPRRSCFGCFAEGPDQGNADRFSVPS